MMKQQTRLIGTLFALVFLAGPGQAGDSDSVDAALKKLTKATKGIRGVVTEVQYAEVVEQSPYDGSGKLYVDLNGSMRVEIEGDTSLTMLFLPPYLYTYREVDMTVEINDVTDNPHMLGQYLLLGFAPAGKEMKKEFTVELAPDGMLDDQPALHFVILPKSEAGKRAIARIELWADLESGLPMMHRIYHASGSTELAVRYITVTRDDELPNSLFTPVWPEGTRVLRK